MAIAYDNSTDGGQTGSTPTSKTYAHTVGGLLAWWGLDETSGNRADSHGSYTLTDNNTVLSGTGKISNAADFESGSSEYLSRGVDDADLDLQGHFTIAGWVNLETAASSIGYSPTICSKDATSTGWTLRVGSDNDKLDFVVNDSTRYQPSTTTFSTATWYHFAVTYDGVRIKIYINGTLELNTTFTTHTGVTSGFKVADSTSHAGRYFDGLIDELSIWNKALHQTQVSALYNSGTGVSYADASSLYSTTDLALYVAVHTVGTNGTSASQPTVTYNSVSMTLEGSRANGTSGKTWIYSLASPSSGSNNIVITAGATKSEYIASEAASYSGVDSANLYVDENSAGVNSTQITTTLTPSGAGYWFAVTGFSQRDMSVNSSTYEKRQPATTLARIYGDSNGTISGSTSAVTDISDGGNVTHQIMWTFAPAGEAFKPIVSMF